MYEENTKNSINWTPFIIKGGIVLAIFIIILIIISLFSSSEKKSTGVDTDDFRNNLITMKDTAFEFFNSENLPTSVGQSVSITLSQMIEQKLLVDFTDNGNSCDLNNSYVKATKTNDYNYALKIQLDCNDNFDYIVTSIEEDKDCIFDCDILNDKNESDDLSSNDSNPSSSSSTGSSSTGSSSTGSSSTGSSSGSGSSGSSNSNVNVDVSNNNYVFNTVIPCTNCNTEDKKTLYYYYKRESDIYKFDACKYDQNTYYTTSYITTTTSNNTSYKYTLQLHDISNVNVNTIKMSSNYFDSDLTDYTTYINTRDQYISMVDEKDTSYRAFLNSSSLFKTSSLKSSNFSYNVSNVYTSNNNYYVDVTIYYYNSTNVDPYYMTNTNYYVFLVPVKFTTTYYTDNNCSSLATTKEEYDKYKNNNLYFINNLKISSDIEYLTSTTKLSSSDGWTLLYSEYK